MITATLREDTYLLLEVPGGYFGHSIIVDTEGNIRVKTSDRVGDCSYSKPLPPGQYTIVGKGNEITEEQWKGIVEAIRYKEIDKLYYSSSFKNYNRINAGSAGGFNNTTESGHSWIISHGMKPATTLILKQLK